MKEEKEKIRPRDPVGAPVRAMAALLVTVAVYLLFWQAAERFFSFPVYYYARLIELLAWGLFCALALVLPMRFSEMGILVPRRVLCRSLLRGTLVSLAAIGVLAGAAALSGKTGFFLGVSGDISRATYFLVAPAQEVLGKSVMLYGFELIFEKKRPNLALFLSVLFFGVFHVAYGIRMMFLSMGLALLTGWMFRRERCVWGCSLVHFTLGFFPFCFGFT